MRDQTAEDARRRARWSLVPPGHGRTGRDVHETRRLACAPLAPPADLLGTMPLPAPAAATVETARAEIRAVLDGSDDRLIVVAGPCAVHDPAAALDYARRLTVLRDRYARDLLIIMRVYFEKPRTIGGWKGLVNDPGMDGQCDMPRGLRLTRQLLLDVAATGLPPGCEWLDPMTPAYFADVVAWSAIGARTSESQVHRQLASGLPMPVGFKNGTDGSVQVAVEGCLAAAAGHSFFGVNPDGMTAQLISPGNRDCHVILRGGRAGPNYSQQHVTEALDLIAAAGLPRRVMVDASHGNSGKDHSRQPAVAAAVADQVQAGERGLAGVMLESFLVPGRQDPGDPRQLVYGQSIVDSCMDFDATAQVVTALAAAVRQRRSAAGPAVSVISRQAPAGLPLQAAAAPR